MKKKLISLYQDALLCCCMTDFEDHNFQPEYEHFLHLCELQKWLREQHNIHVNPIPYYESVDNEITGYYMGEIVRTVHGEKIYLGDDNYASYEEALEAGLIKVMETVEYEEFGQIS